MTLPTRNIFSIRFGVGPVPASRDNVEGLARVRVFCDECVFAGRNAHRIGTSILAVRDQESCPLRIRMGIRVLEALQVRSHLLAQRGKSLADVVRNSMPQRYS